MEEQKFSEMSEMIAISSKNYHRATPSTLYFLHLNLQCKFSANGHVGEAF